MQRGYCMVCMCDLCQSARATYENITEYEGFKVNDRVRITVPNSSLYGKIGTIKNFIEDNLYVYASVSIENSEIQLLFSPENELEVIT